MSKERDLLKRVLGDRTFFQSVCLRREIEQLLAQPETLYARDFSVPLTGTLVDAIRLEKYERMPVGMCSDDECMAFRKRIGLDE
jgi:hypothetical protein